MDVLRLNVLLVNEDPALLEEMKSTLTDQGFTIKTAANLHEANHLLESETFQVLVSDITMPENDGIDLCKKYGQNYPIVMLQGKEDQIVLQSLGQYGCCFLEKSEMKTRLPKAVWTAFKRFRIDQQLEKDFVAA